MAGLIHFRAPDGRNDTPVSAADPLPVATLMDGVNDSTVVGTDSATALDGGRTVTNTAGYNLFVVQFTSIGSGNSVVIEQSNDGLAWYPSSYFRDAGFSVSTSYAATTPALGHMYAPIFARQVRWRVAGYSSGTITGVSLLRRSTAFGLQAVTGNTPSGAPDFGSPVKVGGRYNATPISLNDAQRGDHQLDSRGSLKVTGEAPTIVAATASIANAGTLSGAVALPPGDVVRGLVTPAAWTAAALSFDVSVDGGATYVSLRGPDGGEYSLSSVPTAAYCPFPTVVGATHIKLRSGLSGAVVAQGGQRDFSIITG